VVGTSVAGTVNPDGAAVEELQDASAQRFDKLDGAFDRIRGQIDGAVGFEVADPQAEPSGRFFGGAIDGHSFDFFPGVVLNIWLSLAAAHTDDGVAGLNQTRRQVRSDVAGAPDDGDSHQSFQCTIGRPGTGA
jgi:hypothetical protein